MTDQPLELLDPDRMLLDFVRGRDVECPRCGYNLRDLTERTCPECAHALELRVGVQQRRLLPIILAIAPGVFSGLGAVVLAIVIFGANLGPNQRLNGVGWPMLVLLGGISGAVAVAIILRRKRFLALTQAAQRLIAGFIWTFHVMLFLVMLKMALG